MFDLLISKSDEFIFVSKCTNTVNVVQAAYEMACSQGRTHVHKDGLTGNLKT